MDVTIFMIGTEQREAADTAIKHTLVAGSVVVLLVAGVLSYIVLSTLTSQMRLHYGTEKDDEKTPGSQHVPGPQTPHTTPRTDPTTPTTNGTTPNIESLESSEQDTAAGER
ncbi:uncharacterized protein LOC142765852 [Rhipicephalus microplus]|uniref:uncharacterized protein LOC142765852 n=1 Tax=Rhipicephalus microplus TaxID=6941 RepID=UPI003F6B31F3